MHYSAINLVPAPRRACVRRRCHRLSWLRRSGPTALRESWVPLIKDSEPLLESLSTGDRTDRRSSVQDGVRIP